MKQYNRHLKTHALKAAKIARNKPGKANNFCKVCLCSDDALQKREEFKLHLLLHPEGELLQSGYDIKVSIQYIITFCSKFGKIAHRH
jgi:hypothetical protein